MHACCSQRKHKTREAVPCAPRAASRRSHTPGSARHSPAWRRRSSLRPLQSRHSAAGPMSQQIGGWPSECAPWSADCSAAQRGADLAALPPGRAAVPAEGLSMLLQPQPPARCSSRDLWDCTLAPSLWLHTPPPPPPHMYHQHQHHQHTHAPPCHTQTPHPHPRCRRAQRRGCRSRWRARAPAQCTACGGLRGERRHAQKWRQVLSDVWVVRKTWECCGGFKIGLPRVAGAPQ